MNTKKLLILGGYGNFGKRIIENLAAIPNITLLVAGRHLDQAQQLCNQLQSSAVAKLQPIRMDYSSSDFAAHLATLSPDIVIHTSGPFQGQDYRVPNACITAGCHYIDLADDRRFVCDIEQLNAAAAAKQVLLVSGASSVPGLSSTVVDTLLPHFSELHDIDFAIAPGNQAERGLATVRAILVNTGKAFSGYEEGQWQQRYGWMSPRVWQFGKPMGKRPLANVNIPDIELFPARYSSVRTVKFQAGLELPLLHYGMVSMAWLAKIGLIKNWSIAAKSLLSLSDCFKCFGTDIGGMQVRLTGNNHQGELIKKYWTLSAKDNIGPYIPTLSAIIVAKKLINGTLTTRGAMPCLGLYSLAEFDAEALPLGITHETTDQTPSS